MLLWPAFHQQGLCRLHHANREKIGINIIYAHLQPLCAAWVMQWNESSGVYQCLAILYLSNSHSTAYWNVDETYLTYFTVHFIPDPFVCIPQFKDWEREGKILCKDNQCNLDCILLTDTIPVLHFSKLISFVYCQGLRPAELRRSYDSICESKYICFGKFTEKSGFSSWLWDNPWIKTPSYCLPVSFMSKVRCLHPVSVASIRRW